MEPSLERRDLWWNMHVFTSFHAKNARQPLSGDVLDSDVRQVFLEALGWSEDAYERDMKGVSANTLQAHIDNCESFLPQLYQ